MAQNISLLMHDVQSDNLKDEKEEVHYISSRDISWHIAWRPRRWDAKETSLQPVSVHVNVSASSRAAPFIMNVNVNEVWKVDM